MPLLNRPKLAEYLLALRPTLAKATIVSYTSMLMNIYFDATREGNADSLDPEWFGNHQQEIIKIIQTRPTTSQATILSSVSVIINDSSKSKIIREELKKNVVINQENASSGVKSDKQQDNWLPYEDVLDVWREYLHKADAIYKMPENLQSKEEIKLELKKFMLLSLTTGVYFPPRRSEWSSLKFINYNPQTDNYIDFPNKRFVLNKYKTAKFFGRTEIDIPDELMGHIHKFIEIVKPPSDYFLSTTKGEQYGNSRITFVLNKIFDRKISTSMLRHIYKTSQHMNMPALQELLDQAHQMGHGLAVSLQYIKNKDAR